jgi:hypothetical protein
MSYSRDASGATVGTLQVVDGPDGEFGYVLVANSLGSGIVISNGLLYLTPPFGRYSPGTAGNQGPSMNSIGAFGPDGVLANLVGNGDALGNGFVVPLLKTSTVGTGNYAPGDTVAFSLWFRCGTASNFSDAVQVQFR